jgi:hypothetical protein
VSTVFAGTGTINTSDAREKTQLKSFDMTPVLEAVASVPMRAFQWKDAIKKKSKEEARIHFGPMAQDVVKAFEERGLDPWRFAVLCADEIEELQEYDVMRTETDADGNKHDVPEKDENGKQVKASRLVPKLNKDGTPYVRLGIRFDQWNNLRAEAARLGMIAQ